MTRYVWSINFQLEVRQGPKEGEYRELSFAGALVLYGSFRFNPNTRQGDRIFQYQILEGECGSDTETDAYNKDGPL